MTPTTHILPSTMLASGASACLSGMQEFDARKTLTGLAAANAGARLMNMPADLTVHGALAAGSAAVSMNEIGGIYSSLKTMGFSAAAKKAGRAGLACIGTACLCAAPSDIVLLGQQALTLGLTGLQVAKMGWKDIVRSKRTTGLVKLVLGVGGLMSSIYYLHSGLKPMMIRLKTQSNHFEKTIPTELSSFLKEHQYEIEKIHNNPVIGKQAAVGDFHYLGHGISKSTFSLPHSTYVIKIPHSSSSFPDSSFSHWKHSESDVVVNYKNQAKAREMIQSEGWTHLHIPESYLVKIGDLEIAAEERLEFTTPDPSVDLEQIEAAKRELHAFTDLGGYCDVALGKNAEFVKYRNGSESSIPRIGVFDLDCDSNIIKKHTIMKAFVKQACTCFAAAMGVLESVSSVLRTETQAQRMSSLSGVAMIATLSYLAGTDLCDETEGAGCIAAALATGVTANVVMNLFLSCKKYGLRLFKKYIPNTGKHVKSQHVTGS